MVWFKRQKAKFQTSKKKSIPDGLWEKCPKCEEILFKRELQKALWVCRRCQYHFRIKSEDYLKMIIDGDLYDELNRDMVSVDPLKFKADKKYADQLISTRIKTGKKEVLTTVVAQMNHHKIVLAIMDFSFIGGSMGSVVGEKMARAIDYARKKSLPLITISASGGARMQEGAYSLMQMAKTSAKLALYSQSGGMYISILTDPTTGGVTASYAMLGDVILAEPGALIGFAGPRVIKQTIGQDLPEDFQRAEFLLEKGFIDHIVHRKDLKETLTKIIDFADFKETSYHSDVSPVPDGPDR